MRAEQLDDRFVRAWSTATGAEQWVPAHFFDSPVLSRGLTRKDPNAQPEAAPSLEWTRADLDAYAETHRGLNPADYGNKADLLAAIEAAAPVEPVTEPTADDPQAQQQDTTPQTPDAGENQE